MNPDLLRQRRNLILVSLWLLVFDFAQVSIGKVSVLGTELVVGSPRVLIFLAWLLWAYFFLRYYQYWRAENKPELREAFSACLDSYANKFVGLAVYQDESGQLFDRKITKHGVFSWVYALQYYDPVTGYVVPRSEIQLPNARLIWWVIKSAVFTCINTTHATDHLLPFALAVAAPVVAFATWIAPFIRSTAV
ncbi:hypothetical protein G7069_04320 [Lysobacter sp. HDW10]|uniref:hypothetical protein n=1 Tax=Lysobacter sp. HDW10 TaxID=2714936 RepID=UPI00140BF043|nr:hypothetical protein [Lysobacter sp. HDW10]QIK80892.1 hypothetical protein G7069_04320 [Lysobacter sp. HDW10]